MTAADRPSVTDNTRAACGCDLSVGPNALHIVDDHDGAAGRTETREGVGTGAGEGDDPASTEATSWVARSTDCPEAPAQAHPRPHVTLMARKSGKTQALIESLLAQANERGLTVEVVYPETTTATVEDAAQVIRAHFWDASDEQLCTCGESPTDYDGDQDDDDQWLAWADWHTAHVTQALHVRGLLATARTHPTETEWGYRDWAGVVHCHGEQNARDNAVAVPGGRTLVRREVTAWTEVDR